MKHASVEVSMRFHRVLKMKFVFIFLALLTLFSKAQAEVKIEKNKCQIQSPSSPVLYRSDFRWWYNLIELTQRFQEVYNSEKRLDKRAYFDNLSGKLRLPYFEDRGGDVELPIDFVDQVSKHIQQAFSLKVIDGVFFPDMGHSHFYFPKNEYDQTYLTYPSHQISRMYEMFFKDKRMKVLYHTAEQLKLVDDNNKPLDDERLFHRFQTRNFVGMNDGTSRTEFWQAPGVVNNTVSGVSGYASWSSGFNMSANKNGCFTVNINNEKFSFDLSLYDLLDDPQKPIVLDTFFN